jgi:hypothetical protein
MKESQSYRIELHMSAAMALEPPGCTQLEKSQTPTCELQLEPAAPGKSATQQSPTHWEDVNSGGGEGGGGSEGGGDGVGEGGGDGVGDGGGGGVGDGGGDGVGEGGGDVAVEGGGLNLSGFGGGTESGPVDDAAVPLGSDWI